MIAAHLVDPSAIPISWADIAGLDDVIQELRETVILPIQKKELFADSHLTQPPKGMYILWTSNEIQISGITNIKFEKDVETFVVYIEKSICVLVSTELYYGSVWLLQIQIAALLLVEVCYVKCQQH